MKWTVKITPQASSDPRVISCIRLLTILGFANATMKWYVGSEDQTLDLPPHERVLTLALMLGAVGEAVTLFKKLTNDGIVKFSQTWPDVVREAWDFLHTPEVDALRNDHLRAIRDKVTFHADPEPVKELLQLAEEKNEELVVWATTPQDPGGYPDVAANVVGMWLMKHTMHDPARAELCATVYGALWKIAGAALTEVVPVKGID